MFYKMKTLRNPFTKQELVLKHRTFTGSASSSQVKVFQHVVDLALKNLTSPRLAEALFHKAGKMIPDTRLTPLYMMKYQEDLKNYNLILSQVDVNLSVCPNCQVQEVRCLNRQSVTLR